MEVIPCAFVVFSFGLILIAVTSNFILEYSSNEINLKFSSQL